MYLFFYSNNCQYSRKFFKVLKMSGQSEFFENISVDKKDGVRPVAVGRYSIKEVPSILVNEKIYAGKDAFTWLENAIKAKKTPTMDTRANRVSVPELSGYSRGDSFCLLGDEQRINTPQEGDGPIEKGTFMLPQVEFDSIESQEPSKQQDNPLERLQKERSAQDSMYRNR